MTERPRVRGDCAEHARPCLFVSCRHNLFLDVQSTGAIKLSGAASEPDEMPADFSCALDVADRGPHEGSAIAKVLGVTDERIRQIFQASLGKLRGVLELEALHDQAEDGRASFAERLELLASSSRAPTAREGEESWRDQAGTNRGIDEARERAEADAWADRVVRWRAQGVPMRKAWLLAAGTDPSDGHEDINEPEATTNMEANGEANGTNATGVRSRRVLPVVGELLQTADSGKLVDDLTRAREKLKERRESLRRELAIVEGALAKDEQTTITQSFTNIDRSSASQPQRVLEFVAKRARTTTNEVAIALSLDARRASQVLSGLKHRGLVKARGPKNAMQWSRA